MKIEDTPTTREQRELEKLTFIELEIQLINISQIIKRAHFIKANDPFKEALLSRASDYKQMLLDRYNFLKEVTPNG